MWSKRHEVDYSLQRHHTLMNVKRRPATAKVEACDADPMLVRAAYHHGEPSGKPCPVCEANALVTLNFVFGDQLGQYTGRIKTTADLVEMQDEFGEFTVRVVEVCHACGWNFMINSYLLGDGITRRPPRRRKTVEDIYG